MNEEKIKYLNRRYQELESLKQSIDQNSFELAQIVGHRLKGHGETFGFPEISKIGLQMEDAAKSKEIRKIQDLYVQLEESVNFNLNKQK